MSHGVSIGFLVHAFCFFFKDTATTEIYTLSLHDALPIWLLSLGWRDVLEIAIVAYAIYRVLLLLHRSRAVPVQQDRKSTRLNSSHSSISYAVFCLKKKTPSSLLPITFTSPFLFSSLLASV